MDLVTDSQSGIKIKIRPPYPTPLGGHKAPS